MCKHCDCLRDDPRCAVEAVPSTRLQKSNKVEVEPETKVDCSLRLLLDEVRRAHELIDQLTNRLTPVMCSDFPTPETDVTDYQSGDCEIACRVDGERRQVCAAGDKIEGILRRLEI